MRASMHERGVGRLVFIMALGLPLAGNAQQADEPDSGAMVLEEVIVTAPEA